MHSRRPSSLGARPIALPMAEIGQYVENVLVDRVRERLEVLSRGDDTLPLGDRLQVDGGRLTIPSVRGADVTVRVYVLSQPRSRKTESLAISGGYDSKAQVVIVFLNGAYSPADLMRGKYRGTFSPLSDCTHGSCLPFALYDVLIHELTHASDIVGAKQYNRQKIAAGDESEFAAYYNEPSEVRAYMRQVVEEAGRMATHLKDFLRDRQDLVAKSMKLSTTWGEISPYLTPANRQKILLAVYDRLAKQGLV